MKIDVIQTILDLDGEPLPTGGQLCPACGQIDGETHDLTLRAVCVESLTSAYRDEGELSGEKKIERLELARKIHGEDEPELSVSEAGLLQELVNKRYGSPLVVGMAWEMLEGD